MCGIVGIFSFSDEANLDLKNIHQAVKTLNKRGPDEQNVFIEQNVALAHSRLAIIDTSPLASQPFYDDSGRYVMVYNGEVFNFQSLRKQLEVEGIKFRSKSDTEVILNLYIKHGADCLSMLNGFWAFAIYDRKKQMLFLARDRFGIKPLLFSYNDNRFCFASELKALYALGIDKELDEESLLMYLQLNYIPSPFTIIKNVQKCEPSTYIIVEKNQISVHRYYTVSTNNSTYINESFDDAANKLRNLLFDSVEQRLIADVPLGTFLSGGIDSTIITSIAAHYIKDLNAFTIGFKDEPYFDESAYAALVAKNLGINHTIFTITNNDLFNELEHVLDYLDEPFADSSALAVNLLCKHTKKHITVALSGDGADEVFGGYNKHKAELFIRKNNWIKYLSFLMSPMFKVLPQSRNSSFSNKIRQINRLLEGSRLSEKERYWRWCALASEKEALSLFSYSLINKIDTNRKNQFLNTLEGKKNNLNDVLNADINLVLQGDMLPKVDYMSMSQSLEVRVPFLDYRVVDYMFSLPSNYKISEKGQKLMLKKAFEKEIPIELLNKPKHGFEVPLLNWFRNELKSLIHDDLLSEKFIKEQNIFNYSEVLSLKNKLQSNKVGESVGRIYALIVFQWWWKKYLM